MASCNYETHDCEWALTVAETLARLIVGRPAAEALLLEPVDLLRAIRFVMPWQYDSYLLSALRAARVTLLDQGYAEARA